jgi:hypothetical protein
MFPFTAATTSAADVATGLALAINANTAAGYTALVDPNNNTNLIISHNGSFTAALTVNNVAVSISSGAMALQQLQLGLTGFPTQGQTWGLQLDGTTFSYGVLFRDALADVATGLSKKLPLTQPPMPMPQVPVLYNVTVQGLVITISHFDGTPMTFGDAAHFGGFSVSPDSLGDAVLTPQLVFTPSTWNQPQTVTVAADDEHNVVEGSDALVFPAPDQRVNAIRGPLTINGGEVVGQDQFLNNPVLLPGETNFLIPDGSVATVSSVPSGAGTVTHPVTPSVAVLTLTGTPAAGEVWTTTIPGVNGGLPFSYTVKATDHLADVAAGLALQMQGGQVSAVASGNTVLVSLATGNPITLIFAIRGRATITDPNATHVSKDAGQRPGFDPRMNDFSYAITFLNGPAVNVQLPVASTSGDILSVGAKTVTE